MIKIKKTLKELDRIAIDHYKILLSKPFEIDEILSNKLLSSGLTNEESQFYNILLNNIKNIIISRPDGLKKLINILDPLYSSIYVNRITGIRNRNLQKVKKKELNKEIFKIFDYNKFISHKNNYAIQLAQKLDCKVCLYCNRQFTFTVINKKNRKTRPEFDHFFDKNTNPYLALSLYNLVPACPICNSRLKHRNRFELNSNIHPLIESAEKIIKFKIKTNSIDILDGSTSNIDIEVVKHNKTVTNKDFNRVNKNLNTFLICDLYLKHQDYIIEIIKKGFIYNKSRILELENISTPGGNHLFRSRQEVIELILGNYLSEDRFSDRILSKLTKDVAEQFDLLKYI